MKTPQKFVAFANLSRLGMAPLTISIPILGAYTIRDAVVGWDLVGLGIIGLCAHQFGFSLNNLIDLPLDRNLPGMRHHPLLTGQLNQREAWIFTLLQIPVSLVTYLLFGGPFIGVGLLGLSILFSAVYNVFSKWGWFPRILAELGLAVSISFLCLAGGILVSNSIFPVTLLFSIEMGLILLLLNSISSGLKDLKTDSLYGAQSFVISAGCRMLDHDQMLLPVKIKLYACIIQTQIWAGGIALAFLLNLAWPNNLIAAVLGIFSSLHLRMLLSLKSFSTLCKAQPLLNGYYNYAAVAFLLIPHLPPVLQILFTLLAVGLLWIPVRSSLRLRRYRIQEI